jgi:hypothetical protein
LIQKRYKNNDGSNLFLNSGQKLKSDQLSNASTGNSMPLSGRASLKKKQQALLSSRKEKYKSYFKNYLGGTKGNESGMSCGSGSSQDKKH